MCGNIYRVEVKNVWPPRFQSLLQGCSSESGKPGLYTYLLYWAQGNGCLGRYCKDGDAVARISLGSAEPGDTHLHTIS